MTIRKTFGLRRPPSRVRNGAYAVPEYVAECRVNRVLRFAYHAGAMVKADLINRAMEAANLQSPAAREAVEALFESLRAALERGDRVVLRRFGVFHAAPRKTGVARNPRTGEPVGIPRGRVVRFRPGQNLRGITNTT